MKLPDLRDHDEPLARDLEAVRQLDVAREDQHELVAGAEHVAVVHRTGGGRVEHRRLLPEHAQAVDREPGGVRGRLGQGGGVAGGAAREPLALDRAGAVRRQVQRGDGAEDTVARHPSGRGPGAAGQVGIEHVLGIALRAKPRPHLIGGHAAAREPLAQLGHERGVGLQECLGLLRRRAAGGALLGGGRRRGQGTEESRRERQQMSKGSHDGREERTSRAAARRSDGSDSSVRLESPRGALCLALTTRARLRHYG